MLSRVRIASSVQSRLDDLLLPSAPSAVIARWKRCVPRALPRFIHRLHLFNAEIAVQMANSNPIIFRVCRTLRDQPGNIDIVQQV